MGIYNSLESPRLRLQLRALKKLKLRLWLQLRALKKSKLRLRLQLHDLIKARASLRLRNLALRTHVCFLENSYNSKASDIHIHICSRSIEIRNGPVLQCFCMFVSMFSALTGEFNLATQNWLKPTIASFNFCAFIADCRLFLGSNLQYAYHYLCQQCHEASTWFCMNNHW